LLATQQGGEDFALIAGAVFSAIEAGVDGMAQLLQQHRLDLCGRSALQPGAIEIDPFTASGAALV
jgi:hypothetical protein